MYKYKDKKPLILLQKIKQIIGGNTNPVDTRKQAASFCLELNNNVSRVSKIICLHIIETSSVGHNQSLLHSDYVGKEKDRMKNLLQNVSQLTFAEKKENTVRLEREEKKRHNMNCHLPHIKIFKG